MGEQGEEKRCDRGEATHEGRRLPATVVLQVRARCGKMHG
jgi:hypothetical protein